MNRMQFTLSSALAAILGAFPAPAFAQTPMSTATSSRFDPQPVSSDRFDVGEPESTRVVAPDGATIRVDVSKPIQRPGGSPVAGRHPVILASSPYMAALPVLEAKYGPSPYTRWRDYFVARGYAFALAHNYGTGDSGGCLQMFGADEVAANSAVVEWLGKAKWSTGKVGMLGTSYDATTALSVAAKGSPTAKSHLAAVVAESGLTSWYDVVAADGVSMPASATANVALYSAIGAVPGLGEPVSGELLERHAGGCRAQNHQAALALEPEGNYSEWFAARSLRPGASTIQAATLMISALYEPDWTGPAAVGFFDRIPETTPHKLILGQWQHGEMPFNRLDHLVAMHAWFDRFLMDLDTNVEDWPSAQVEDTDGRWRAESRWPRSDGTVGQLALGLGSLGTTTPRGSTTYFEPSSLLMPLDVPGRSGVAAFETPPLAETLRISGLPVLDLWLELDQPDTHISAQMEAFDAEGNQVLPSNTQTHDGQPVVPPLPMFGSRSVQHLSPIIDEFRQTSPSAPDITRAVRVPVRFYQPVELVVPKGGLLRIRISGGPSYPSTPSGSPTQIRVLHDCASHVSALRFWMPRTNATFLDVADTHPVPAPGDYGKSDNVEVDGGLADKRVCGQSPIDPFAVTRGGDHRPA